MKKLNWIVILLIGILFSCESNQKDCCVMPSTYSEFIFGTYFGECIGEGCIETFKIEDGQLFEDQKDSYAGPFPYPGDWNILSQEKFELAAALPAALPVKLTQDKSTTIGQPDAGDWGGIYIEIAYGPNDRQHWNIDLAKRNVPAYLHDFIDEVGETINALQD